MYDRKLIKLFYALNNIAKGNMVENKDKAEFSLIDVFNLVYGSSSLRMERAKNERRSYSGMVYSSSMLTKDSFIQQITCPDQKLVDYDVNIIIDDHGRQVWNFYIKTKRFWYKTRAL